MRAASIAISAFALLLAGCSRMEAANDGDSPKNPGRFAGIGVFEAGRLWEQLATAKPSADPQAARIDDDEHIIVVVDTHTGEVRQCGDLSGYCVAMNPWSGLPGGAPAKLVKHGSDLDAEARRAAEEEAARKAGKKAAQ